MSYRKFDDPALNRDDSRQKVKTGGFFREPWLRGLQGIVNRVIGDAAATACTTAVCATAATGVATTVEVKVAINGCEYNIVASGNINLGTGAYSGDNLEFGKGTMGTNCVTKFLIYGGTDGTAHVAGPGNIVQKKDYATAALAAAECRLPDLPENCVALGSLLLQGPEAAGANFSVGGAGTMGTCTFTNFYNMPYQEPFKAEA
jgi:hypothetical protein